MVNRRLAGGEGVAEVVAGLALPVVGAVAPGDGVAAGEDLGRVPGAADQPRRLRGGRDPADRVALGLAPGNRAAVAVEAGRVLEPEAEQEAGSSVRPRAR